MYNFPTIDILFFIVFLLLSALFSSAETAYTAVNQIRLRQLFKSYPKKASRLQTIYKHPKKLITAILIGNNITNVAASALATALLLDALTAIGVTNTLAMMSIITTLITTALLIFGEITPKTLALRSPEKLALFLSRPFLYFLIVMGPIITLFQALTEWIVTLFQIKITEDTRLVTIAEIKTMFDLGREEGVLEKEKNLMLHSVFEFSETVVREIMTPRTDTILIDANDSIKDAIQVFIEKGHSRLPVFEDKIDNIIGIIYAKDLLSISEKRTTQQVRTFMRDAVFIPESKVIESVLQQMKRSRLHMAIVVDEYGGMSGIVTLEDIIEEIMGEIQDEYDTEESPTVNKLKNGHYTVDASMNMKDLGDSLDLTFSENDDFDTIGGLVITLLGKFPEKGEIVLTDSLRITVKATHKQRILELDIEKLAPTKPLPSD